MTVDDPGGVMQRRATYDRYAARLPRWHRTEVDGVPTVTAERAVVERCRQVPFVDRLIVGDAALRLERTTCERIREALDFCSGWSGIRGAREAAAYFDGRRESPLESLSFGVFVLRGLPLPKCQVSIVDDWGDLLGVVDFFWPEYGVIGEADGRLKYRRSPGGLARSTTLLEERYVVVRWGWSDATVADGAPLAARVEKAFARAARQRR